MKKLIYGIFWWFILNIFIIHFVSAVSITANWPWNSSCTFNVSCNGLSRLSNFLTFNPWDLCTYTYSKTNGYCNQSAPSCPTSCGFGWSSYMYYQWTYYISCTRDPGNVTVWSNGAASFAWWTIESCYVNSWQISVSGMCQAHYGSCPATPDCPPVGSWGVTP